MELIIGIFSNICQCSLQTLHFPDVDAFDDVIFSLVDRENGAQTQTDANVAANVPADVAAGVDNPTRRHRRDSSQ